jgi:hypothetical protein
MRFAELHPVVRPKIRPFDLPVEDSSDARESIDEVGEFRLICAEADWPTKQTRTSRCCLLCLNSRTGIRSQKVKSGIEKGGILSPHHTRVSPFCPEDLKVPTEKNFRSWFEIPIQSNVPPRLHRHYLQPLHFLSIWPAPVSFGSALRVSRNKTKQLYNFWETLDQVWWTIRHGDWPLGIFDGQSLRNRIQSLKRSCNIRENCGFGTVLRLNHSLSPDYPGGQAWDWEECESIHHHICWSGAAICQAIRDASASSPYGGGGESPVWENIYRRPNICVT